MFKYSFSMIFIIIFMLSCTNDVDMFLEDRVMTEKETTEISSVSVENVQALKALTGAKDLTVTLEGYYTKGDKEPLRYTFKEGSFTDNGGTVILPAKEVNGAWIAELNRPVSIEHYGAVGDDNTDNTEAIKRCIANHDNIWIPKGVFRTNTIETKSDLTIDGKGTLKLLSVTDLINVFDSKNVKIQNISLDGNYIVDTNKKPVNSFGINVRKKSQQIHIENVTISNFGKDGIYINEDKTGDGYYPEDVYIKGCKISTVQRNGISVISAKNVFIDNCDISFCILCCIDIEPNPGSSLTENTYVLNCNLNKKYNTGGAGLQCSIGAAEVSQTIYKNVHFTGNTVSHSIRNKGFKSTSAIKNIITDTKGIALQGFSVMNENTIYYNGSGTRTTSTTGAIMAFSDSTIIESNVIYGAPYNGIVLYETSYCKVSNNIIKDFGQLESGTNKSAGIYILREGNNNRINGNTIESTLAEKSYGISGYSSKNNIIYNNTFNVTENYYIPVNSQQYLK